VDHTDTSPVAPVRTLVADAGLARHVARAQFARYATKGAGAWIVALAVLEALAGLTLRGGWVFLVVAVFTAALLLLGYRRLLRCTLDELAPGSELRAAIEPDGLRLELGGVRTVRTYRSVRRVEVRGDVVFLQWRSTGRWGAIPAALLPEPDLGLLRTRVAAAADPVGHGR